jgi:peptidoglycan/xylan/chitin deacetylase (PgdA/CDA1 family)
MRKISSKYSSRNIVQKGVWTLLLSTAWLYAETSEQDLLHSDEAMERGHCITDINGKIIEGSCQDANAIQKQRHLEEIQEKLDAIEEAIGKYDSGELTSRLRVLREEFEEDQRRKQSTAQQQTETVAVSIMQEQIKVDKEEAIESAEEKIIYLTFDDGPLLGTSNVLEVLEEEQIDATMFFVGKHILGRKSLFKRAKQMPNILIGNHTYSHANGHYTRFYNNGDRLVRDIEKTQDIIGGAMYQRLAGRNVWRVPGVFRNDYGLSKKRRQVEASSYNAVAREGYFIYGWDVEWSFSHKSGKPMWSAEKMVQKINSRYRNGRLAKKGKVILLAHDFMFRDKFGGKKELRKLITLLKKSGWKFETIKNYSSYQPHYYVRRDKSPGSRLALNTYSETHVKKTIRHKKRTYRKRKKHVRRSHISSRVRPRLDMF